MEEDLFGAPFSFLRPPSALPPDATRTAALDALRRRIPPGEQAVAAMPGVGQGLLDSLRAVFGAPLAFDTATIEGKLGEFERGLPGVPTRITINPALASQSDPVVTLGHEVLAHGVAKVATSPLAALTELIGLTDHQEEADAFGRALVSLTGREKNAPPRKAEAPEQAETRQRVQTMLSSLSDKEFFTLAGRVNAGASSVSPEELLGEFQRRESSPEPTQAARLRQDIQQFGRVANDPLFTKEERATASRLAQEALDDFLKLPAPVAGAGGRF